MGIILSGNFEIKINIVLEFGSSIFFKSLLLASMFILSAHQIIKIFTPPSYDFRFAILLITLASETLISPSLDSTKSVPIFFVNIWFRVSQFETLGKPFASDFITPKFLLGKKSVCQGDLMSSFLQLEHFPQESFLDLFLQNKS